MIKLKEDIENLETTETTTVVNQPTGAAKEESKTLWDRFMEATKEPKDAPLFGAKEQPVPDDVEEPKAELKEDWNVNEDKPDAEQFEAYVLIQKSGITNMFDTRFVSEVARDVLDVDLTRFNCMYIFKHYEELMNEYADEINVSDSKVRTFMNWYSDIYGEDDDLLFDEEDAEIEFDESLNKKSNERLNEGRTPEEFRTNTEWANYLTRKLKLDEYDSDTLLHDLNNLRADEWVEEIEGEVPSKVLDAFETFFEIGNDDWADDDLDEALKKKSNKLTLDESLFESKKNFKESADSIRLARKELCKELLDWYNSNIAPELEVDCQKAGWTDDLNNAYIDLIADLNPDFDESLFENKRLNEVQLDIEHNPKDRAEATLMSLGTNMKKASSLRASLVKEYQYNLDDDSKLNRIADFASLLDAAIQGALDEIDEIKAQGEQKDDEAEVEVANESLNGEVDGELLKEEIQWQNYQERCADCIALVEKDGRWFCDEAQDFCENVINCPEGLGELVESCCEKSSKFLKEEDEEVNPDDDVEIPDEVVEDAIDEIKDAFSNSEITSEEAIDKIFDCIEDNEFKLELASDVVKAVEEEGEEELSEDLVYGQATLDDYLDVIKKYYRNRNVEDVIDSIFKMFPDNKAAMDLASSVGEVIEEYSEDEEY